MNEPTLHAWTVRGIEPMDHAKGRKWNQNIHCTVVAASAERAIATARQRFPDLFVHCVNHIGVGALFDQALFEQP